MAKAEQIFYSLFAFYEHRYKGMKGLERRRENERQGRGGGRMEGLHFTNKDING